MNKASKSDLGNKEIFSRNLQRYVVMSGENQKDIAKAIDVSAGTFCDWMKGRAYPRMDKIQLLANYFGVRKSDLVEDVKIEDSTSYNQEQKILHLFRKVPDDKKEKFLQMIQLLVDTQL